jgi:hypothetical protein
LKNRQSGRSSESRLRWWWCYRLRTGFPYFCRRQALTLHTFMSKVQGLEAQEGAMREASIIWGFGIGRLKERV